MVRVGYRRWEQRELEEVEWFSREPRMAALFVTSVMKDAKWTSGESLPRCPECGKIRIAWGEVSETARRLVLPFNRWPETDLFLLEGGMQSLGVFVTDEGIGKLKSGGWRMNLDLVPVEWK